MTSSHVRPEDDRTSGRIAFVLPVYNEAAGIATFHETLARAVERLSDYELAFVYVDDGSSDSSLEEILRLRDADSRVAVIGLSRNFGHQMAVTAGLDAVDADAVVVMDTDLQDPPAVCLELVERWQAGADVVYAQRRTRNDTVFKRASADIFYRLLARASSIEIPRNTGDFRLMDRKVVDEIGRYREHNRFLRGLVSYVGFRQEAVLFDRDARYAGSTGYPLKKMIRFAGDGIFSFSTLPLTVISRVGFIFSFLSVVGAVYALAVRILTPENAVPGWAFLAIVLLLIGGVQITMLGILGGYLGRVYKEVQNRPLYAVALRAGDPAAGERST